MNQWHQSHIIKIGTHGFRASEKEAMNLEVQRNPLQILGFTCKLVVHDQL